jgi:WD40 repeat protein
VIQNYEAHKGPVTSIDFHPYSATIISSSDDGKTKIWDLKKGCLSYTLDTPSCDAVFSRHGDYFLTGGT